MKSRSLSSIKNEISSKTKIEYNAKPYHVSMHEYSTLCLIQLLTNYNTFTGFTVGTRMYVGRIISYASRRHARITTYAIRLDGGATMSDYRDW